MFSFRKDTTRAESRKLVSEHNQNAENDRIRAQPLSRAQPQMLIHISFMVNPVHIFMARSRASKNCFNADSCFHRLVHFDCVPGIQGEPIKCYHSFIFFNFQNKKDFLLISRCKDYLWPAHSPDLSPADCFL